MSALVSTVSSFVERTLYRGREGYLLYLGHRLAGLGTLAFLAVHILDTSTVYFFPSLYPHAIDIYRSTPFMLSEILLVVAVIYHGVNGLRIILHDSFPRLWQKEPERVSFWKVAVLAALLSAPAVFFMGRSLYWNNLCRCPPETEIDPVALANFSLISIPLILVVIVGVFAVGASIGGPAAGAARAVAVPRKTLDTWSWVFMRWSGALLIPLAWGHVLLQDVLVGVHAIDIDFVALRWATLGWRVYDIALLGFAFAHGMNGLRGIVNDYILHRGWNQALKWLLLLGWAVITAIGAVAIVGGVRQ